MMHYKGDTRSVDHLVFVIHGIGPFADIRLNSYKSLVDCGRYDSTRRCSSSFFV